MAWKSALAKIIIVIPVRGGGAGGPQKFGFWGL